MHEHDYPRNRQKSQTHKYVRESKERSHALDTGSYKQRTPKTTGTATSTADTSSKRTRKKITQKTASLQPTGCKQ